MFPNTADSASQTVLSSSPSSPPASARNQNRRQPLTDGGRNSACLLAPPIQRGVTASSSTSTDLRPAMVFSDRLRSSRSRRLTTLAVSHPATLMQEDRGPDRIMPQSKSANLRRIRSEKDQGVRNHFGRIDARKSFFGSRHLFTSYLVAVSDSFPRA